jgi:hypothetical protein
MKIIKLIFFLSIVVLQSCKIQSPKINGVSFVAENRPVKNEHITPIVKIHANYAAIMPFGFIRELSHPEIIFNTERQWFGETAVGAKQYIETVKKRDIKIMIKPQIWVWRGEFTGGIKMNSEENWKVLEGAYLKFILEYAKLAQEVEADIFCIGTELESFIDYRPEYWKELIDEVKKVYSGKLTYAANWNEYNRTPFWDQLDYIGIDAYFPVSDLKTPSVESCIEGWKKYVPEIVNHSNKYNKPILFTEFGYRSMDHAGKIPWLTDENKTDVNLQAQSNALSALFQVFWEEDWFAGGFVWKWFIDHDKVGGNKNNRFTPQNKPAESLIKKQFSIN